MVEWQHDRIVNALKSASLDRNDSVSFAIDNFPHLREHRRASIAAGVAAVAQNRDIQVNSVTCTVEGDMDLFGTDDYSFDSHAAHWSEMKAFALSFQFLAMRCYTWILASYECHKCLMFSFCNSFCSKGQPAHDHCARVSPRP